MAKRQAIALPLQTVIDIAIREHGGVEGAFAVLGDNPQLVDGLGSPLTPGQVLKVLSEPVDVDVVEFFRQRDARPVTGELMLPDPCEGYVCMPEFVEANQLTTPANQATLEATPSLPVGRKYLIYDLNPIVYGEGEPEMPETTSLFARNVGNIMEFRGYEDTGGVEGSPWNVIAVEPGTVVTITGVSQTFIENHTYKVWTAATGTLLYPTGKFAVKWIPRPSIHDDHLQFLAGSTNTQTSVAPSEFSPCRFLQLERSPFEDGETFEPVGERLAENADGPWPEWESGYWYRIIWSTGQPDAQCVQGSSALILVF